MKKLFLTFLLCLICSTAHALTPQYLCTTATTWAASNWVLSTVNQASCTGGTAPTAGDEATLNSASGSVTVGANATTAGLDMTGYTGTLTINSSVTLTISAADPLNIQGSFAAGSPTTSIITTSTGTTTLLATPTGASFPQLNITGAGTLASGGFIWPGAMKISEAGSVTLTASSTWQNNGLTTISAATLLTPSSATLKCNGGLTQTSALSSSSVATINISGGTWTGGGYALYGPLILGNMSIGNGSYQASTNLQYAGSSLTLTTGSTITGANDLLLNNATITITSNRVFFPGNFLSDGNTETWTLIGDLSINGIIIIKSDITMSGAYNITVATLELGTVIFNDLRLSIVSGRTITVTNALKVNGYLSIEPAESTYSIQSGTPFSPAYLNYTGTLAKESVYGVPFTDIVATGPCGPFYGCALRNYNGGTLTRTQGIVNVNASNINKRSVNYANGT